MKKVTVAKLPSPLFFFFCYSATKKVTASYTFFLFNHYRHLLCYKLHQIKQAAATF